MGILNSAIFSSFHIRAEFGTILEGPPPHRYAPGDCFTFTFYLPLVWCLRHLSNPCETSHQDSLTVPQKLTVFTCHLLAHFLATAEEVLVILWPTEVSCAHHAHGVIWWASEVKVPVFRDLWSMSEMYLSVSFGKQQRMFRRDVLPPSSSPSFDYLDLQVVCGKLIRNLHRVISRTDAVVKNSNLRFTGLYIKRKVA